MSNTPLKPEFKIEDLYQKIINKYKDLIFIIDEKGNYKYSSKKEYKNTKNISNLFVAKDWDKIEKILQSGLKEESPSVELEVEIKLNDKTEWHLCKISCIDDCNRKNQSFLIALQNIQNRILREESLIKAKEKAEAQEKLKSSFLANMSHEIRTPMNSIIGFSDLMERSNDEEEKNSYLEIIKSSGQFLLNIINDIIDVSKIESGLLDIKIQRVSINTLIDELADIYGSDKRLVKDEVKIVTHKPLENGAAVILTDKTRLRQILSNLMDNAVKFTQKGEINFGYELKEKEKNEKVPQIRFFVKDTGVGIPKVETDLIFDRYHQIREGDEKKGSGLGLTIVKALVSKLGGDMKVNSQVNKGSEFSFKIAYLQRKGSEKKSSNLINDREVPELKGRHILIAEDVDANYRFVSAIMRKTHAKLSWAKNGKEAVEFVLKNENIDLVLMDLRMPIMDGYKASGHIKTLLPKIPIIALTAFAVDGDMEKALDAGCDDYLSKPINIPDFYSKLNFYLNM